MVKVDVNYDAYDQVSNDSKQYKISNPVERDNDNLEKKQLSKDKVVLSCEDGIVIKKEKEEENFRK